MTHAPLAPGAFLRATSPREFTTCALHRRGRVGVRDVLAAPDSLAVRLLDHGGVVEAPSLLNACRLQVVSHEPIVLHAKEQTADDYLKACRMRDSVPGKR
jgi:hypothetical protein